MHPRQRRPELAEDVGPAFAVGPAQPGREFDRVGRRPQQQERLERPARDPAPALRQNLRHRDAVPRQPPQERGLTLLGGWAAPCRRRCGGSPPRATPATGGGSAGPARRRAASTQRRVSGVGPAGCRSRRSQSSEAPPASSASAGVTHSASPSRQIHAWAAASAPGASRGCAGGGACGRRRDRPRDRHRARRPPGREVRPQAGDAARAGRRRRRGSWRAGRRGRGPWRRAAVHAPRPARCQSRKQTSSSRHQDVLGVQVAVEEPRRVQPAQRRARRGPPARGGRRRPAAPSPRRRGSRAAHLLDEEERPALLVLARRQPARRGQVVALERLQDRRLADAPRRPAVARPGSSRSRVVQRTACSRLR